VISERVLVERFDRLVARRSELRVDIADLRDDLLAALVGDRARPLLQISPTMRP
jgi:hypothetical protein